jgi:hypothetical protein
LERVVLRALSPGPAQRFQSAAELLAELVSAFPGHASEAELAHFVRSVCGSSLSNRRALLNEALCRSATAVAGDLGGELGILGETTPDTLSPAALAVRTLPALAAPRWQHSVRLALLSGAVAFAAAFTWALAQSSPNSAAPAAEAVPAALEASPSIAENTANPATAASSSASAQTPTLSDSTLRPPALSAAPVEGKAMPQSARAKKRKALAVGQRYGI